MDKEKFKADAKKAINEVNEKIDIFEAKVTKAKANMKVDYERQLAGLKTKRDNLKIKYEALMNASEEKWDDTKSAFSAASEDFKEGFSKLGSLFK